MWKRCINCICSKYLVSRRRKSLGFVVDRDIQNPGPDIGYLAKVPAGKTAANWDGSGAVWFKVWEEGLTALNSNEGVWPTSGMSYLDASSYC